MLPLALFACAAPVDPGPRLDVGAGTVEATGYTATRTGTDSAMGTITSPTGDLVIHYDIGAMAGTHMHEGRRSECSWFDVDDDGGRIRSAGTLAATGELVVTLSGPRAARFYPANFYTMADSDAERQTALRIATSYQPASRTDTLQVWIPRGLETQTENGTEYPATTMEADPVLIEVDSDRHLGHTATWRLPDGTTSTSTRCEGRLQGIRSPAGVNAGTLSVELAVFETHAPCAADWAPESRDYRELYRVVVR